MFPFQPPWATKGGEEGGQNRFLLAFVASECLLFEILWWLAVSSMPQLLKLHIFFM